MKAWIINTNSDVKIESKNTHNRNMFSIEFISEYGQQDHPEDYVDNEILFGVPDVT